MCRILHVSVSILVVMKKISVVIPVYKVEDYLCRCVDSVCQQTYDNLEIWLVDDGSPDRCGAICDEYAFNDSRIQVIHKENGGLSDARNCALDQVTGDYICFVDSDDWIPQDSLETMFLALERNHADMAVGNITDVYDDGTMQKSYWPYTEETVLEGDQIYRSINKPCAPNRLYRACVFKEIRFPVGRLFEDVFTYHHVLEKVSRIVFTGKENYYYYIRKDSIMHTEYSARNMDIIDAIADRVDYLEKVGQHKYAMEAMMFIYSQLSAAYAFLDEKDLEGLRRREECTRIYRFYYPLLMKERNVSKKQKIRLFILRYFPRLHTKIWGKNMPYNLA